MASTRKIQRKSVIEAVLSSQISGLKTQWNHDIGALIHSDMSRARRMASVFGICSPTTTWSEVTETIATVQEIARHPPVAEPRATRPEEWGDEPVHERLGQRAEDQAANGDAELGRGKKRIQIANDLPGQRRPLDPPARLPLVDDLIELTRAHFDQRKFGGDEKPVQQDKEDDQRDLPEDPIALAAVPASESTRAAARRQFGNR